MLVSTESIPFYLYIFFLSVYILKDWGNRVNSKKVKNFDESWSFDKLLSLFSLQILQNLDVMVGNYILWYVDYKVIQDRNLRNLTFGITLLLPKILQRGIYFYHPAVRYI